MNQNKVIIFLAVGIFLGCALKAAWCEEKKITAPSTEELAKEVSDLRQNQIAILDKNYSTSIQTLATSSSIIAAFLGILGLIGVGSIFQIRKKFDKEYQEFHKKSTDLTGEVKKALEENKKQSDLIEILQLDSRANYYLRGMDFSRAFKLYHQIVEQDPEHRVAVLNLFELALFLGDFNFYKKHFIKFESFAAKEKGHFILVYFDALEAFVKEDTKKLGLIINRFLQNRDLNKKERYFGWQFNDLRNFVSKNPNFKGPRSILGFADYLSGLVDGKSLKKTLVVRG